MLTPDLAGAALALAVIAWFSWMLQRAPMETGVKPDPRDPRPGP